jgi:hypothetical protein
MKELFSQRLQLIFEIALLMALIRIYPRTDDHRFQVVVNELIFILNEESRLNDAELIGGRLRLPDGE